MNEVGEFISELDPEPDHEKKRKSKCVVCNFSRECSLFSGDLFVIDTVILCGLKSKIIIKI